MISTLEEITPFTKENEARLIELTSKREMENGVSVEESKERTSLIFLRQANGNKELATDENVDEKSDDNYENNAIRNYNAYLSYTS